MEKEESLDTYILLLLCFLMQTKNTNSYLKWTINPAKAYFLDLGQILTLLLSLYVSSYSYHWKRTKRFD